MRMIHREYSDMSQHSLVSFGFFSFVSIIPVFVQEEEVGLPGGEGGFDGRRMK